MDTNEPMVKTDYCLHCGYTYSAYHSATIGTTILRCDRCNIGVGCITDEAFKRLSEHEQENLHRLIRRTIERGLAGGGADFGQVRG